MPKKGKTLSINLLPKKEESFGEKFLRFSFTFGRYIIIGTEIVVLLVFLSRFKLDREFIDLKDEIHTKEVILASFKPVEDDVNRLQHRLKEIKHIEVSSSKGVSVLPSLVTLTPSGITYKTITISADKLSVIGLSDDSAKVGRFISNLKESQLFKKDSIVLENLERGQGDAQIRFAAEAIVEKGEN